ncbi:MAG: hypothetical protein ACYCQJ_05370 [Nitrososphaerales archaeon]
MQRAGQGISKTIVVAIILLIIVLSVFLYSQVPLFEKLSLQKGTPILVTSDFSFNNTKADNFFHGLSTPTGLLETFVGSKTIYLSDDQALDHAALLKLGDQSLADQLNSSIVAYGGFFGSFNDSLSTYGYWNGAFVILGLYPNASLNWNMYSGMDQSYGPSKYGLTPPAPLRWANNSDGYDVRVTIWGGPMGNGYKNYADLELYYSLYLLHAGDYVGAVNAFKTANSYWDRHGFADNDFKSSPNGYASYKLAVDLIAFKALMNNANTVSGVSSYNSTIVQVESMMSKLQGSDGGVISNYEVVNGQIQIAANTYENGETTSLFVLAE